MFERTTPWRAWRSTSPSSGKHDELKPLDDRLREIAASVSELRSGLEQLATSGSEHIASLAGGRRSRPPKRRKPGPPCESDGLRGRGHDLA